ncbi:hypothetical protein B0T19DRAFT_467044 [Cercophora scortea]|uniref:Uncharacterized protein n=1 Tax=Cercophora scortea TaxID=314031 RepID=A0AAE0I6U3_9PEZI|nr:hypothetical protein B0T19DRAFT_467044 [Cercophora scortea]
MPAAVQDRYHTYPGRPQPPGKVYSECGRFGYDQHGFHIDGKEEAYHEQLIHELVNKGLGDCPNEATKLWITTQLASHGIAFKQASSKPKLIEVLVDAFRAGRFTQWAPEIEEIRDSLRNRFELNTKMYHQAVEDWKDEQFATLNGHIGKELDLDVDRFLAKYFLDGRHGRPDPAKTPNPLTIHYILRSWRIYRDHKANLDSRIRDIPGLRCYYSGFAPRVMLIIGWGTAVNRAAEIVFNQLPAIIMSYILPPAEACFDIGLCLKKRLQIGQFDDDQLSPPQNRSPDPVILSDSFRDFDKLEEIAARIPELHVQYIGSKARQLGDKSVSTFGSRQRRDPRWLSSVIISTIIGWDKERVDAEASRLVDYPGSGTHTLGDDFYKTDDVPRELQDATEKAGEHNHSPTVSGPANETAPAPSIGGKRNLGSINDPWGVQAAMAKRQKMTMVPRIKKEDDEDHTGVSNANEAGD